MLGALDWQPYPYVHLRALDAVNLPAHWAALHAGDAEPLPSDPDLLSAWALFHRGEFEAAFHAGRLLGHSGVTVANKACLIHADFLEPSETTRLKLYCDTAERALRQINYDPHNPNAHYFYGYALGRYSQGTSVAQALAQGHDEKIKKAFETAIALQALHADAHLALGTFHAEVIDKVGAMIGNITYGAHPDVAIRHFRAGMALIPHAPLALSEYARGLLMLDPEAHEAEAMELYARAAAVNPRDAMEHLGVLQIQAELAD